MEHSLSLCLMGVCMVWLGHLEKPLKVISRLSCLVLQIALNHDGVFLIEVISLLVIVIIASGKCDMLGVPLWPPHTTFGAPLSAFAKSLGQCPSAASRDRLFVALDENGPNCLLP
jgi:hypothetical protein